MKKNLAPILIDSHAHLSAEAFDQDRDQVLKRAFQGRIGAILCPSDMTEPKELQISMDLAERYENITIAAGVHPHNAKSFEPHHAQKMAELAKAKKIRAIGEIGLDFYYKFSTPHQQEEALRDQLHLAEILNLPVILHSRESGKELATVIQTEQFTRGGILHCFSGDWETAKKMMDLDFFISFSGIITYPGAYNLREVAKKIPLERLLFETDSPYLVPLPYRGKKKRNEPIFVIEVAEALAAIKNVSLNELARRTFENFKFLFMFEIKNLRC